VNGAPHSEPASYAGKLTGHYADRTIRGGIGYNLPQEAPAEFADAVVEISRLNELPGPRLTLRKLEQPLVSDTKPAVNDRNGA
jgi:hypothetical protein